MCPPSQADPVARSARRQSEELRTSASKARASYAPVIRSRQPGAACLTIVGDRRNWKRRFGNLPTAFPPPPKPEATPGKAQPPARGRHANDRQPPGCNLTAQRRDVRLCLGRHVDDEIRPGVAGALAQVVGQTVGRDSERSGDRIPNPAYRRPEDEPVDGRPVGPGVTFDASASEPACRDAGISLVSGEAPRASDRRRRRRGLLERRQISAEPARLAPSLSPAGRGSG